MWESKFQSFFCFFKKTALDQEFHVFLEFLVIVEFRVKVFDIIEQAGRGELQIRMKIKIKLCLSYYNSSVQINSTNFSE